MPAVSGPFGLLGHHRQVARRLLDDVAIAQLHNKVAKAGVELFAKGKIDQQYADPFKKISHNERRSLPT